MDSRWDGLQIRPTEQPWPPCSPEVAEKCAAVVEVIAGSEKSGFLPEILLKPKTPADLR